MKLRACIYARDNVTRFPNPHVSPMVGLALRFLFYKEGTECHIGNSRSYNWILYSKCKKCVLKNHTLLVCKPLESSACILIIFDS